MAAKKRRPSTGISKGHKKAKTAAAKPVVHHKKARRKKTVKRIPIGILSIKGQIESAIKTLEVVKNRV